jgi:tetrahydromethanopterin S-methyltransferase subunit B
MNPTMAFLADVGLVAILSVGLVAYVKTHLNTLLIELCGTAERASFWLAFSNVTLVLVPLIFALDYKPEFGPDRNLVYEMATQLKYAIIGFVIALSSLAIILFRFIPRSEANIAAGPSR